MSNMNAKEKEILKKKIIVALEDAIQKVAELEELTKPISPENAIGRVSRMDAINNKSVAEAALRSTKRKRESLKMALSRIDNEDFGDCSLCKRPIRPARLMYMPESNRCVRCADR